MFLFQEALSNESPLNILSFFSVSSPIRSQINFIYLLEYFSSLRIKGCMNLAFFGVFKKELSLYKQLKFFF